MPVEQRGRRHEPHRVHRHVQLTLACRREGRLLTNNPVPFNHWTFNIWTLKLDRRLHAERANAEAARRRPAGHAGPPRRHTVSRVPDHTPFDPIAEAHRQWSARWPEHADHMAAVTSVMRVQQLLLARVEDMLKPYGLTFAAYEALRLLAFTRAGSLPMGKMGVRLMVHPAVGHQRHRQARAARARRAQHVPDRPARRSRHHHGPPGGRSPRRPRRAEPGRRSACPGWRHGRRRSWRRPCATSASTRATPM